MKATKLFAILAMALLMVAMPSQAQSRKERKAAEKAAWEARQQFIKDSTERANKAKLDAMDRNIEQSGYNSQRANEKLEKQDEQSSARTPKMRNGRQRIEKPCYAESLDKPGEYLAGLGISAPRELERDAKQEANDVAINDIASRFMGIIEHGTQYYSQSGKTISGKKIDESDLQRITTNIVKIQMNKYARQACYDSQYDEEKDVYVYYIAIQIPEDALVNAVATALEKQELVDDASTFKEQIHNAISETYK
ncbi:MAG: hypothetical protein IKN91_08755 [Paludibacteraceae bacterium]|nr:hypothetical protein [Paludibacteraceae bacterium]